MNKNIKQKKHNKLKRLQSIRYYLDNKFIKLNINHNSKECLKAKELEKKRNEDRKKMINRIEKLDNKKICVKRSNSFSLLVNKTIYTTFKLFKLTFKEKNTKQNK